MQHRATIWPWEEEDISIEYQRSLQDLERFLHVDISELYTLEDLSAVASLVGHDLHVIAVTRGKSVEQTIVEEEPGALEPFILVERKYVFTRALGMSGPELVVTASEGHVLIAQLKMVQPMGYRAEELRIRLPSNTDIALGNIPNVADESIYAIDIRGGRRLEHRPVQEPDSPEVQQAFAYTLKDALREIVARLA